MRRLLGVLVGVGLSHAAWGNLSSGALLTNCASATYMLPGGAQVGQQYVIPGVSNINLPQTQCVQVEVTDNPQLCMQLWKTAIDYSGALLTGTLPGAGACFQISFSNCGADSAFSVTFTDVLPANVVKAAPQPGSIWVSGGTTYSFVGWATTLLGPWYTYTNTGKSAPLYMRWILGYVGMHKSGYIKYCVTVQ